jgi:hypothetical protein
MPSMSKPVSAFSLTDVAAALQPITPAPVFGADDVQGAINALAVLASKRVVLERLYKAAETKDAELRKQLTTVLSKDGDFRTFGDRMKGMTQAEVAASQVAIAQWQAVSRWVTNAKSEQAKAQAAINGLSELLARFDAGDEAVIAACTPQAASEPTPEPEMPAASEPEPEMTLDQAKAILEDKAGGNWIWKEVAESGIKAALEAVDSIPQDAAAMLLAAVW